MSTLVQRKYTDEELCESIHYRRSLRYLHSLFGETYYQNRPLASPKIIVCPFKLKRPAKRKSLKERFEDGLVNLNVFQMTYDALKFLSSNNSKSFTNPLKEWLEKRKTKRMEKAALGIHEDDHEANLSCHFSHFNSYPSGMKDLHTHPAFHSAKKTNSSTTQKRLDTASKHFAVANLSPLSPCKCCPSPSAGLLDPYSWYENYKDTVTYSRIPREHKKKVEVKFRALYSALSAHTAIPESPRAQTAKRPLTIDASNFALFVNSVIPSAPSSARQAMPMSIPAKIYGPDAIALVSGPDFRRRDNEVQIRSLSRRSKGITLQNKGKSNSFGNVNNSDDNANVDGNNKKVHEVMIPMPSSSFRYLDEEFKLSKTSPGAKSTSTTHERPMTPVTGSKSTPYIVSVTPSSRRPNDNRENKNDNPDFTCHGKAQSRASVPHIPGAHGDVPLATKNSYLPQAPLKPNSGFLVGVSPHTNPKEFSKSGRSTSNLVMQPKDVSVIEKSVKATQATASALSPRSKEASKLSLNIKKKSSLNQNPPKPKTSARRKPKVVKRFKQSISTVSLSSPRSKSKPIGLVV